VSQCFGKLCSGKLHVNGLCGVICMRQVLTVLLLGECRDSSLEDRSVW
jgi:hypothetical protein